eukprot:1186099-Prymnesium_polylepis.1
MRRSVPDGQPMATCAPTLRCALRSLTHSQWRPVSLFALGLPLRNGFRRTCGLVDIGRRS